MLPYRDRIIFMRSAAVVADVDADVNVEEEEGRVVGLVPLPLNFWDCVVMFVVVVDVVVGCDGGGLDTPGLMNIGKKFDISLCVCVLRKSNDAIILYSFLNVVVYCYASNCC